MIADADSKAAQLQTASNQRIEAVNRVAELQAELHQEQVRATMLAKAEQKAKEAAEFE
jgi:hypothetical protein